MWSGDRTKNYLEVLKQRIVQGIMEAGSENNAVSKIDAEDEILFVVSWNISYFL